MIPKKNILEFYASLDTWENELFEAEPFWLKCKACQNNEKCCLDTKAAATKSEWLLIKDFLLDHLKDKLYIIKKNILMGAKCPFKTDNACLIHTVRPLACRVTPYMSYWLDSEVSYNAALDDCSSSQPQKKLALDLQDYEKQNLVSLPIDENDTYIYYLTDNRLKVDKTFNELIKQHPYQDVLSWLKNWSYFRKVPLEVDSF